MQILKYNRTNVSSFVKKMRFRTPHIITDKDIKPNPNKIKTNFDYPVPKTSKQIKGFLGLVDFYRKFIKYFANLAKSLIKCLKKMPKLLYFMNI